MTNRLANESSPYLLQHKDNPVDWYPWGDEAFAEAKRRDVPVLVSIGYSTCHWCHVMARESFSDPDMATVMNDRFVNIKVDREERPDVDAIYMQAVQAMGTQGGWPLNVFLTPDGHPFFGGTYWPKHDHPHMPGFQRVLATIATRWKDDRDDLVTNGQKVADFLRQSAQATPPASPVTANLSANAVAELRRTFDATWGGFGGAPKFPQPSIFRFLLRHYRRTGDQHALRMVEHSLEKMAEGGIHDQLGGGFARYSVDEQWHVPHFEKMLYDNAQLLDLYAELWQVTGDDLYRDIATGIVTWLEREMLLPGGAFAAALDADTEGVEGKSYVWTASEIDALLPPETADLVKLHYGISDPGSFEGKNVLRIVKSTEEIAEQADGDIDAIETTLAGAKQALLAARQERVAPGRDDKVIAGWNGLAIHALAHAGRAFDEARWVGMAENAATFILETMRDDEGALARTWNNGQVRGDGTLEDYAAMSFGLLELYAATGTHRWLETAYALFRHALQHFGHTSGVGFFDTSDTADGLIARPRELTDGAIPSGNGLMAELLYTFGVMRQHEGYAKFANLMVESLARPIADHPLFMGQMLAAAQFRFESPHELVFAGDPASERIAALRKVAGQRFEPLLVTGYNDPAHPDAAGTFPMLDNRPDVEGGAAYLCKDFTCLPAITTVEELQQALDGDREQ